MSDEIQHSQRHDVQSESNVHHSQHDGPTIRAYSFSTRNPLALIALGLLVVLLGAALFTVGLAILASVAVVGSVVGLGFAAVRKLTGSPNTQIPSPGHLRRLDPTKEVFLSRSQLPSRRPDAFEDTGAADDNR